VLHFVLQIGETMKNLHHLVRVRMRSSRFHRLQEIAENEKDRTGNYISVSDLIRIAVDNWLQTYESVNRLNESYNKLDKD
jgi:hypothetical protein